MLIFKVKISFFFFSNNNGKLELKIIERVEN